MITEEPTQPESSWLHWSLTVPNIPDKELKCLAACCEVLRLLDDDPQAKKRISEYLLAKNT